MWETSPLDSASFQTPELTLPTPTAWPRHATYPLDVSHHLFVGAQNASRTWAKQIQTGAGGKCKLAGFTVADNTRREIRSMMDG